MQSLFDVRERFLHGENKEFLALVSKYKGDRIASDEEILEKINQTLTQIKEKNPLTHCITNSVTINDCANAVLAIGGSPFMAEDAEELEDEILEQLKSALKNLERLELETMLSGKYDNHNAILSLMKKFIFT